MSRTFACCASIALGLAAVVAAPVYAEEPQPVTEDVLEILKERGLVDEGQYNELVAKNQTYEERNQNLLGRIEFSGDMRLRYENFWFRNDEFDVDRSNRNRLRIPIIRSLSRRFSDTRNIFSTRLRTRPRASSRGGPLVSGSSRCSPSSMPRTGSC
jgi:hypothetical protein